MTSPDRSFEPLLALADPTERRTRAELIDRALRTALLLLDGDAASIAITSRRSERIVLHSGSSVPAALPMPEQGTEALTMLSQAVEPISVPDLSENEPFSRTDGCPGVEAGPVLFTPLPQRNRKPAYLAVYRRRGRARFTNNDIRTMLLLGAWLGTSLEYLRLATGSEKLAVTDDLTEVYNFRFLKTALRREVRRASRFRQELSVVLVDVDHLHALHDGSDLQENLILKEVASVLAQQVRSFDLLARYGPDEFVLVLPQTGREGAGEVAERMRVAVERHGFKVAGGQPLTVSLGVACFPQDAMSMDDLVRAADRALGLAKSRGRNRVVTLAHKAA